MKLEREFHTIQIQGFIQLMPGLVSWDKWTPKAGQNQFGSFAQGNACTDRQEILNLQRQTPKLYSYSSQGVGKTSKNAELDDLWKLFVILLWSCTGSLIRQNFTSLCALSNLPSLLTRGECQEYPGASNFVHGPKQHSSNCYFFLTLSFFFFSLGNSTEDNNAYFKACDTPVQTG